MKAGDDGEWKKFLFRNIFENLYLIVEVIEKNVIKN